MLGRMSTASLQQRLKDMTPHIAKQAKAVDTAQMLLTRVCRQIRRSKCLCVLRDRLNRLRDEHRCRTVQLRRAVMRLQDAKDHRVAIKASLQRRRVTNVAST